jgi:hypothetical protein
MNISRDQIIQLLESRGNHDQAQQAAQQLPGQVDTDNQGHASILSKFGLNPGDLGTNSAVWASYSEPGAWLRRCSPDAALPGVPETRTSGGQRFLPSPTAWIRCNARFWLARGPGVALVRVALSTGQTR